MRRQGAVCFGVLACWFAGCDSVFVPPPPPGLRPAGTQRALSVVPATKEILLILPAEQNPDLDAWDAIARKDAGDLRVAYRSVRPEAKAPAGAQAELIRKEARNADALMVVTDRSPETTAALVELSEKKKPIVLLGRALPDSPEAAKVKATLVAYEPMRISAKKLAVALMEDVKRSAGADAKGPFECVLVRVAVPDETLAERDAALEAEAKAAGFEIVATVTFNGDAADANAKLLPVFKAHPKIAGILTDDEVALSGITLNRHDPEPPKMTRPGIQKADAIPASELAALAGPDYRLAGYIVTRSNINLTKFGQAAAVADRNAPGLIRKALAAARDLVDGKDLPKKIEVDVPFIRSNNFMQKVPSL